MKFLIKLILFATIVSTYKVAIGQSEYQKIYDNNVVAEYKYSYKGIRDFANKNNTYDFMAMGYFMSANNTMYIKTKNRKYLDYNLEIVKPLLENNSYLRNKWVMNVDRKNANSIINGEESLVFEGYFFRYLAEFYSIINSNDFYKKHQTSILKNLKRSFDKWNGRSRNGYKDQSRLFHERFHIAANWAVVSLYLSKYYHNKDYVSFYSEFDEQLKKALDVVVKQGYDCYVWNSTYPMLFTSKLKRIKSYDALVQDVTHGNHVINYVITSHELGVGVWTKDDLRKFANTIKYIVWNPKSESFSDNVDGTNIYGTSLSKTGWRQSDGWMKLIKYDSKLKSIYLNFYKGNKSLVDSSSLGLQFISNLL